MAPRGRTVWSFGLTFESTRVSIPATGSYCLATLMSSDRTKQICLWITIEIYLFIYSYPQYIYVHIFKKFKSLTEPINLEIFFSCFTKPSSGLEDGKTSVARKTIDVLINKDFNKISFMINSSPLGLLCFFGGVGHIYIYIYIYIYKQSLTGLNSEFSLS